MNDSDRSGIDLQLPSAYKIPIRIRGYRVYKADGNNSQTVIEDGDELVGRGELTGTDYIHGYAEIDDPQVEADLEIVSRGDSV